MYYSKEDLSNLQRKELQKLCKQFGVKANKKSTLLIEELLGYFVNLQKEEKKLEDDLLEGKWLSEDEAEKTTSEIEKLDREEEERIKNDVLKEVERRAEEKLTKIPRFCPEKLPKPSFMSPAIKSIQKSHKKEFKKMDSIDDYLEKRRKRANLLYKQPTPKASVAKIDKDISFNFTSKLKSPKPFVRTSPRLTALQVKDTNIQGRVTPGLKRKSVQFSTAGKSKVPKPVNKLNQTLPDFRSPSINRAAPTPKKTPIKFDLQASLKKPVSYKPHTGKLKNVYFADRKSTDPNKTFTITDQKKSVKEDASKKVKLAKDKRRAAVTDRRNRQRDSALSKRRGLVS